MQHVWGDVKLQLEAVKTRENLENLSVAGRIKLKWILDKQSVMLSTGMNWLRIGSNGRIL
jgi:hypothetical protein